MGVRYGSINGNVIPAPSTLAKTFIYLVSVGKLQLGFFISFQRVLEGFAIAAVIGVVVGFVIGIFASANRLLSS